MRGKPCLGGLSLGVRLGIGLATALTLARLSPASGLLVEVSLGWAVLLGSCLGGRAKKDWSWTPTNPKKIMAQQTGLGKGNFL